MYKRRKRIVAYGKFDRLQLTQYRGGSTRSSTTNHQEQPTFIQAAASTADPAHAEPGSFISEPSCVPQSVNLGFNHDFGPGNISHDSFVKERDLIDFE